MKLLLHPDKRKINGPKVDNGFTVSFDIGEHEREIVGELIAESVEEYKELINEIRNT